MTGVPGRRTWESLELPVLEAIEELGRATGSVRSSNLITKATGIEDSQLRIAITRLHDAGYVDYVDSVANQSGGWIAVGVTLRERGLVQLGVWPNEDAGGALLAVIEERIGSTADPEERSRLERLRDGLLGVGGQVATSVLVEMAKRVILGG